MPLTAAAAAFLAPIVIEGVTQTAGVISANRKTDLDRRNEERLEELRRRSEMNALGLTDEEEAVLRSQQEQSRSAAQTGLEAKHRAAMAASGSGSGAALAQAQAAQQEEMTGQQKIGETIAAADLAERASEEDEIEALIAAQAQRQIQKRTTRSDALSDVGDVAQQEMLFRRLSGQGSQGPGATTGAAAQARKEVTTEMLQTYGISEEEAEDWADYFSDNAHLARKD
tara:strand:- start:5096 stop:5776 length:681 start_codon:yes stop_codon:yes gene_type:complete